MNTKSWTAPTGYLGNRDLGVCPFVGDEAGRILPPLTPAKGSGLPVPGAVLPEPVIGIQMRTADRFGTPITTTVPRFNGTTLGIPSSRRPLS